jgi:hypothetical protein
MELFHIGLRSNQFMALSSTTTLLHGERVADNASWHAVFGRRQRLLPIAVHLPEEDPRVEAVFTPSWRTAKPKWVWLKKQVEAPALSA